MQQTAVELLVQELFNNGYFHYGVPENLIKQAKEMEKEQIELAHIDGGKNQRTAVKYYNETFKSE